VSVESYETENDLCNDFIQSMEFYGWTTYPEQNGWDILFVRRGIQLGVQAKLVGGFHVLQQALPTLEGKVGPHYRSVLVGRWKTDGDKRMVSDFAKHLRILVLESNKSKSYNFGPYSWIDMAYPSNKMNYRRSFGRSYWRAVDWRFYRRRPDSLEWLPPFVPKLPAGVPGPTNVSKFKVIICEAEILCEYRGWICVSDIKSLIKKYETKYNPSSLLSGYFKCTHERVEGRREHKWVSRSRGRPSSYYGYVYKELKKLCEEGRIPSSK